MLSLDIPWVSHLTSTAAVSFYIPVVLGCLLQSLKKRESNAVVSLDAGYMQRFNPGYVRGPGSAINSVIFTNRWEFMCIFKLCSVFTPHWLIGHGRWGRAPGSTNHSWRQSTNHRAGSSCLGFGQHMYCYSVILKKWMVQNENTYERQCTCCFNCALILVALWI